jgi:hypothetical protein
MKDASALAMVMRHLAHAGHSPAVGVMRRAADWTDNHPARIAAGDRVETIRAAVLGRPAQANV